jgi:hypothetical protein
VKAIQTHIRRPTTVLLQSDRGPNVPVVAESRLNELRSLKSAQFDFSKLIRLCEELNKVFPLGCYYSTAMLVRSILDHVPPIFGKTTFSELGTSYGGGGRSFREAMHGLDILARKIADGHLHAHARKKESLPTAQQVQFGPPLDLLLGEIVRTTSTAAP